MVRETLGFEEFVEALLLLRDEKQGVDPTKRDFGLPDLENSWDDWNWQGNNSWWQQGQQAQQQPGTREEAAAAAEPARLMETAQGEEDDEYDDIDDEQEEGGAAQMGVGGADGVAVRGALGCTAGWPNAELMDSFTLTQPTTRRSSGGMRKLVKILLYINEMFVKFG